MPVALAIVLALPASAAGHAGFVSSAPAGEAVVEVAPTQVVLRFNQAVGMTPGSVRVFDGVARPVPVGKLVQPRPNEVLAPIEGELERGSYTVVWRVISDDVDPVADTFVFHVGAPGARAEGVAARVAPGSSPALATGSSAARAASYLLLLLCCGGALTFSLALRSAGAPARQRLLALLAGLAAALALTSGAQLALHRASLAGDVPGTRVGSFMLAQCGLAVALAAAAAAARRGARPALAALPLLAAPLLLGPVLTGHARMPGAADAIAETAGVLAAAILVGGLGFLLLAFALAPGRRPALIAEAVPRFAVLAAGAVCALLVAGAFAGDGALAPVRLALAAGLLGLVAYNVRHAVPRLRADIDSAGERARFLRVTQVEGVALVLVAFAAGSMDATPAGTAAAPAPGPFTARVALGTLDGRLAVRPARTGWNRIELRLPDPTAAAGGYAAVHVWAAQDGAAPLRFTGVQGTDPGTFAVPRAYLPHPGPWTLRVSARRGGSETFAATLTVPLAGS